MEENTNEKELLERRRNVALGLILLPMLEKWIGTNHMDIADSFDQAAVDLDEHLDKMIESIQNDGDDILNIEDDMNDLKECFRRVLDLMEEDDA